MDLPPVLVGEADEGEHVFLGRLDELGDRRACVAQRVDGSALRLLGLRLGGLSERLLEGGEDEAWSFFGTFAVTCRMK